MQTSSSTALVPAQAWAMAVTPSGRVHLEKRTAEAGERPVPAEVLEAFERGDAFGVLHLGAVEVESELPPTFGWWRDVARLFVAGLCSAPAESKRLEVPFPTGEVDRLILQAPPMTGAEYLNAAVVDGVWHDLAEAATEAVREHGGGLQGWLHEQNEVWNRVGRVVFHLAENDSPGQPFAFLATYTDGVTGKGRPAHRELGGALRRFAGAKNRSALLGLLTPVQRAALESDVVKSLVSTGELFHPLAWTADQAHAFLRETPILEKAGIALRVPDWWRRGNAKPGLTVKIGNKVKSKLGADELMDFKVELAMGKARLTEAEWMDLLASGDGLVRVKGQWVEVNHERLAQVLAAFRKAKSLEGTGIAFAEALRLVTGASAGFDGGELWNVFQDAPDWANIVAGDWLGSVLASLRGPEGIDGFRAPRALTATLRPYQLAGVKWMWMLSKLGLGACLADDMGLGKTVQVLALLLALRERREAKGPHLLVAPATLLANWRAEIERFAPDLRAVVVHPSLAREEAWQKDAKPELVLTSYGMLQRSPELLDSEWDFVILDEAQAIKNPGAGQTRKVKELKSARRIALTGTPIENRLGDLWSLFDFLNPGLLGTTKQFTQLCRTLNRTGYGPLRNLVRPYLLRRLKSEVLADLPPKTEVIAWCGLSRAQAGFYQRAVEELRTELGRSKEDPFRRSGVVLTFLTRFKQICNHPAHFLGGGDFDEAASGKLARLRDLCETIAERQEKVLVFTQFQEMTAPLAAFLEGVFKRPGLVLHGGTPIATRKKRVEEFQREDGPPFFVVSVKAGGTGLNLTAAAHVVHFDRWWNPAVENQATDRAHRIGQKKSVLVHKLVVRGTIEEKIQDMLDAKQGLARDVLSGDGAPILTELSDEEILRMVTLDAKSATAANDDSWAASPKGSS